METALRITPLGWPGSTTFRVVIRTVSSGESDNAVQDWPPEVLMLTEKVLIILCASFIRFCLASGEGITEEKNPKETIIYMYTHQNLIFFYP